MVGTPVLLSTGHKWFTVFRSCGIVERWLDYTISEHAAFTGILSALNVNSKRSANERMKYRFYYQLTIYGFYGMGKSSQIWEEQATRDVQIKREHNGLDASSRQLQCPWDGRCWLVDFYGTAVRVPVVTALDGGAKHVSVEKPGGGVRWLWDGWGRGRDGELRREEWNNAADVLVISSRPWRLITQLVLWKRRWLLIKRARENVCRKLQQTRVGTRQKTSLSSFSQ